MDDTKKYPFGSQKDGTILGFRDAFRSVAIAQEERRREQTAPEPRWSHEDDPIIAARLRAATRAMQPQLEAVGVDVAYALEDSFDSDINISASDKFPPSPTRRQSEEIWRLALAPQQSAVNQWETSAFSADQDEGYQSAKLSSKNVTDSSWSSGFGWREEDNITLANRPLPQHIFVPKWVYFAREQHANLWMSFLRHYFTFYRWPKFTDVAPWFIQACLANGISPDKYERTSGFAPIWVFYLRDLVQNRTLNKDWFKFCINEFFDSGRFPKLQDMPAELLSLCEDDSINETDFFEVADA